MTNHKNDESENISQNILNFDGNEASEKDEWKEIGQEQNINRDIGIDSEKNYTSLGNRKVLHRQDEEKLQLNIQDSSTPSYQKPSSAGKFNQLFVLLCLSKT